MGERIERRIVSIRDCRPVLRTARSPAVTMVNVGAPRGMQSAPGTQ